MLTYRHVSDSINARFREGIPVEENGVKDPTESLEKKAEDKMKRVEKEEDGPCGPGDPGQEPIYNGSPEQRHGSRRPVAANRVEEQQKKLVHRLSQIPGC